MDDTQGDSHASSLSAESSGSGDGSSSESSSSDDAGAISEVPGCNGSPPADDTEAKTHSNCDGHACGCDEVCVAFLDYSGCGSSSWGCRVIPAECSGLADVETDDCMAEPLCGDAFQVPYFYTSYDSGVLRCETPAGDCGWPGNDSTGG